MHEDDINWDTLERLRSRFLAPSQSGGVYWETEEDLAHYHATFACRIGWKWDHALQSAAQAGFKLQARRILDWGCGTGIATLRALAHFGPHAFEQVLLWDHSLLACRFASETITRAYPDLKVEIVGSPSEERPVAADTLVLVSHALTELGDGAEQNLLQQMRPAAQIFLLEPGDYRASRKLSALRDALLPTHAPLAPCTRCAACPMLVEENQRHWCHFFAKPPVEAFTASFWSRFSQRMEIDLRSLPYSFLAAQSKILRESAPPVSEAHAGDASRLIGRPRQFKGYTRLLSCDAEGLRELELQKRDDKTLWKILKKGSGSTLFRWTKVEPRTGRLQSGVQVPR